MKLLGSEWETPVICITLMSLNSFLVAVALLCWALKAVITCNSFQFFRWSAEYKGGEEGCCLCWDAWQSCPHCLIFPAPISLPQASLTLKQVSLSALLTRWCIIGSSPSICRNEYEYLDTIQTQHISTLDHSDAVYKILHVVHRKLWTKCHANQNTHTLTHTHHKALGFHETLSMSCKHQCVSDVLTPCKHTLHPEPVLCSVHETFNTDYMHT